MSHLFAVLFWSILFTGALLYLTRPKAPITDTDRKLIANYLEAVRGTEPIRTIIAEILNKQGEAAAERYLLKQAKAHFERANKRDALDTFLARYTNRCADV